MVRVEFDDFIKELSAFFERGKPPAGKTMDLWFEEVRYIKSKFILFLLGEAKSLETWPRNLPAWMRSKASELAEKSGDNNPYKIHDRRFPPWKYAQTDCPKCQGKGLYDFHMDWPVRKDEDGKTITRHVVKPALCECTEKAEYGF